MKATDGVRVETSEESAVTRSLEIEVDAARVDAAFERAYDELRRRARVRGFRPGKVPRAVLERLYGPGVAEDVERRLVGETLPVALEQAAIRPVTEPQVDAQAPQGGRSFRYTARVEVKPEFELADIRGLRGRRPAAAVPDEEVEAELEALRQRQAQLVEEPEDASVAEGHVVTIDYVGRIGGETFEGGSRKDVDVEIGSGRFLPGFEEQLAGARAGEDREVRITFPDEFPEEAMRGKEAVFAVHVAAIKRREVPALDDELAKDFGEFETLDELRARVRENLMTMRQRSAESALHRSLVEALIERNPFEVPPGLVDRRLERMLGNAHEQLRETVPHDALHTELARWREEWRPQAEHEVRRALLLEAVARQHGIVVDDADVEARIEQLATQRGTTAARLRKTVRDGDLAAGLRVQIADERALELLATHAEIEEVTET